MSGRPGSQARGCREPNTQVNSSLDSLYRESSCDETMKGSVKFLACLLYWTNLYIAKATVRAHVESRDKCAGYEALYPTIFEQLAPFFGGITQEQVDKASMHYAADWDTGPKHAHTKFNISAAQTLPPQHPDYPWYTSGVSVSAKRAHSQPGELIFHSRRVQVKLRFIEDCILGWNALSSRRTHTVA